MRARNVLVLGSLFLLASVGFIACERDVDSGAVLAEAEPPAQAGEGERGALRKPTMDEDGGEKEDEQTSSSEAELPLQLEGVREQGQSTHRARGGG